MTWAGRSTAPSGRLICPEPCRTVFDVLHIILLIGFIGVTALLMLLTVANRLRMERVLLSWRTGRFFGLPIWPMTFLGTVALLWGYAWTTGTAASSGVFAGYLLGGACWFFAILLANTLVVTEVGIVRTMRHPGRMLAWGQVVDYFEVSNGDHHHYVFFYEDGAGVRRRFELKVPARRRDRFHRIVRAKIDARMDFGVQQAYGKKALEG